MDNTDNLCVSCMTHSLTPGTDEVCANCGAHEYDVWAAPHHLTPRTMLNNKYLVGRVIGEGGFGITYVGWDTALSVKIAIKEYYPNGFVTREAINSTTVFTFSGDKGAFYERGRERFIDEARRLARFFGMPGIVSVKDFFTENDTAYIIMEYLEGATMKTVLANMGGRMQETHVLEIMKPLIRSLAEMHNAGLIHRDIAPDNIMIQPDGSIKLLDFGAAREVSSDGQSSAVVMKHGYTPEEQYDSDNSRQGPWTDVYALCATIYRAIEGDTPPDAISRLREDAFNGFTIPVSENTDTVVRKGLALAPKDRWQNVGELRNALYPVGTADSLPQAVMPQPATDRSIEVRSAQGVEEQAVKEKSKPAVWFSLQLESIKSSKKKKIALISIAASMMAIALIFFQVLVPISRYNQAVGIFNESKYIQAYEAIEKLSPNFRDVRELLPLYNAYALLQRGRYQEASTQFIRIDSSMQNQWMRVYDYGHSLLSANRYEEAYDVFMMIKDYGDSNSQLSEAHYRLAQSLVVSNLDRARELLVSLGDYKDSVNLVKDIDYDFAVKLLEEDKFSEAYNAFSSINDYKDSAFMMDECRYRLGIKLLEEGRYVEARDRFAAIVHHKNSMDLLLETRYREANDFLMQGDYKTAYDIFLELGNYKNSKDLLDEVQNYLNSQEAARARSAYSRLDDDFIFHDSDSRYLEEEELWQLTYDANNRQIRELRAAINEIYARRGAIFITPEWKAYFETKHWYSGTVDNATASRRFNEYEKGNLAMLLAWEKKVMSVS